MFCPRCGKEIPDTASFCPHCGETIAGRRQVVGKAGLDSAQAKRSRFSGEAVSRVALRTSYALSCGAIAAMVVFIMLAGGFVRGTNGTIVGGREESASLMSVCLSLVTGGSVGNPTMASLSTGVLILVTAAMAIASWAVQCGLVLTGRRLRLPWTLAVFSTVLLMVESLAYTGLAWRLTPWVAWDADYATLPQASIAFPLLVPELVVLLVLLAVASTIRRLDGAGQGIVSGRHLRVRSLLEVLLTAVGAVCIVGLLSCAPVLDVATGGTIVMVVTEVIGLLLPRSWALWVPVGLLCLAVAVLFLVLCGTQAKGALVGDGVGWSGPLAVMGGVLCVMLLAVVVLANAFLASSAGVGMSGRLLFSPVAPSTYWVVEALTGVGALIGAATLARSSRKP